MSQLGIKGRKTGVQINRVIKKDFDDLENIADFFATTDEEDHHTPWEDSEELEQTRAKTRPVSERKSTTKLKSQTTDNKKGTLPGRVLFPDQIGRTSTELIKTNKEVREPLRASASNRYPNEEKQDENLSESDEEVLPSQNRKSENQKVTSQWNNKPVPRNQYNDAEGFGEKKWSSDSDQDPFLIQRKKKNETSRSSKGKHARTYNEMFSKRDTTQQKNLKKKKSS